LYEINRSTACYNVLHSGYNIGADMQLTIKERLIESESGYKVHCYKTDKMQPAILCKGCKSLRGIDPVEKIIKCREVV